MLLKNHLVIIYFLLLLSLTGCREEMVNPKPIDPPPSSGCDFLSLKIDGALCAFDQKTKTFFHPIHQNELDFSPYLEVQDSFVAIYINDIAVENFSTIALGTIQVDQAIPVRFITCDGAEENYQLNFTRLPIIQIQTDGIFIYDDPKQAVQFQLNDPDYLENEFPQRVFTATVGIETRGGSAQIYPKRSYGLELWSDPSGDEKLDAPLLGMRNDDDWILDAMYIDHAKMRNRVSTDLWLDIATLYYQDEEPKAKPGTQGKFVEVFIDDNYHGLYAFTERMDRKQLKLEDSDPNDPEGLLYKSTIWGAGIVTFENYFPSDPTMAKWDGWEQKYPDPEDFIYWNPLDEFTQFVLNSSDDVFKNQIGTRLSLENAIDYFILLNLIRGDDNRGKNIYFSRYEDDENFILVPWDMDATWGRDFIAMETSAEGILSNGLFDRLLETDPDNFRAQLKQRWFSLRGQSLSHSKLINYFDQYATLFQTNGAFQREKARWDLDYNIAEEIAHINTWIDNRLLFLDDYYSNL